MFSRQLPLEMFTYYTDCVNMKKHKPGCDVLETWQLEKQFIGLDWISTAGKSIAASKNFRLLKRLFFIPVIKCLKLGPRQWKSFPYYSCCIHLIARKWELDSVFSSALLNAFRPRRLGVENWGRFWFDMRRLKWIMINGRYYTAEQQFWYTAHFYV